MEPRRPTEMACLFSQIPEIRAMKPSRKCELKIWRVDPEGAEAYRYKCQTLSLIATTRVPSLAPT